MHLYGYAIPKFTKKIALCAAIAFLMIFTYKWTLHGVVSSNKKWPTPPREFLNRNFTTTEIEPIFKIDADLVGRIWPKPGSLENRIVNQLNYMREYAAIRGDNRTDKKLILRVGDFNFNDIGWIEGQDRLKNDHCPLTDCWFTTNKSLSKIADALLISQFSQNDLKYYTPKPKHQIWITQHLESPHHDRLNAKFLKNLVNWSATYRQESTLVLPYAAWTQKNNTDALNHSNINYAKGKTKKVAWFVSNCADKNGRRAYANELKKHIQVDIYGSCGSLSCPIVRGNVNCYAMLKKDYKFYLAFENSNCIGYITEKLHWNALT